MYGFPFQKCLGNCDLADDYLLVSKVITRLPGVHLLLLTPNYKVRLNADILLCHSYYYYFSFSRTESEISYTSFS